MSICCAVLMCHAPIVIPEVGGERSSACAATTAAMRQAAEVVVAHRPDLVVVLSPHTPRHRGAFGLLDGPIAGDLGRFGVPGVSVALRPAPEALDAIARAAAVPVERLSPRPLDHGALVPLVFLAQAGWSGPTVVVALPAGHGDLEAMGEALGEASEGARWALVASGDMSHRLQPGAPAGHHPRAQAFDTRFVYHLDRGELRQAVRPDPELRALAAEDVIDTTTLAAAAIGWRSDRVRRLAYEGPFGVGYCEAILYAERMPPRPLPRDLTASQQAALLDVATEALAAHLHGSAYVPPRLRAPWDSPYAAFVSLYGPGGALRGCIGHLRPLRDHVAAEVAEVSVKAATADDRFDPVTLDELPTLTLGISVLGPATPCSEDDLDPRRLGVIVRSGRRTGVLLPGLQGVDTVAEQLAIARRKAGITGPCEIACFEVVKLGPVQAST